MKRTALVTTAALGALAALALAGCKGLSVSDSDLPRPAITHGSDPATCGAPAGSGTMTLSDVGTTVVLNAPASVPVNRVEVVGTSTGLDAATTAVYLFLLPIGTDCPALDGDVVPLAADGSFTGVLDMHTFKTMRVVAFAAPTGTVQSCIDTDSCVNVPGYVAVSNALEIRID